MAAASLGRLTLDLVAKIGNFIGPMTQAERQARNSSNNIADSFSIASVAATAFGAAVAGVSIGGMVAFANETINMGNEIKKFSQLANTSIHDFQYYAKGAETAGIGMESFADKMKDMQDRIGDFHRTGGGPLADFFENIAPKVGVTIQQFQKLSGPEALQLYYNSLEKVNATQNDMKFYLEAIISDSSLLIPLLKNGGEGFKKWGDAAERANAIMSDEMVESLALAKENVQLLNIQWEGLKTTLINNVVPVVQAVADNMDNVKAVAFALTAAIAVKLVPSVVLAGFQLTQLTIFSIRAGVGLIGLAGSGSVATGAMVALRGAMAFLGGPLGLLMLAAQAAAAGSAFYYMKKGSDDADPSLQKQGKTIAELTVEYNKLSEAQQRAFKYQETVELNELTDSYIKAQQQVRAYASSIAEVVAKDEATKNTVRGWIKEFDAQKISAETLANRINNLGSIGNENKSIMDKHAVAATGAKNAMDAQQKVVGALDSATKGLARANDQATASANDHANATENLTKKQVDALKSINDQVLRSRYIDKNVAAGWSREKAEAAADYRDNAGIDYTEKLTQQELKIIELGFKFQQQNKVREESEKKIAEVKQKQVESQKKMNELVGASALSGLRIKSGESVAGGKVRAYTADFAQLSQQALGSSLNRFTAFNDLYHKGTNSKHATGNAFDFTVKNAKEASQAIKTLNEMAQRYGFTIKTINEYASPSKRATGGHVHVSVLGYKGKSEDISDAKAEVALVRGAQDDMQQIREETLERQKSVYQLYLNDEERMVETNKEAIKAIEMAYAKGSPDRAKYIGLQQVAYKKDVAEYQEAQKLKTISEKKQLLEAKSNWMTAADYAQEYYALIREEILNTASYSPEMKDARIKEANFNQGLDQNAERENVWGDYKSMMGLDDSPYQQDIDLLAEARAQMLITEEQYQQQRLGLQMSYGSQYGADFAGMMMGLVDSSSKAYAVLGGIQKGAALFSTAMNSYAAISAAWASAPFPYNLPAVGMATMETGLLQAAVSALSPVGFADGGFTGYGGKYEVGGIVHKGEGVLTQEEIAALGGPAGFYALRESIKNGFSEGGLVLDAPKVLNPNQNKDLTNYLSQAQSNSSQSQPIENNLRVIMVKDENEAKDWLYSPEGERAFLYHMKRNRSKV
ncbi:hypothetical protein F7P73_08140 [Acinetobacter bohemicus]|uniref:Phage tail tape measure protein, lambda family n=1 Tax=Acinetobacter bohemicus TaxID=1435036 RepID=A0A1I6UD32_9GAMM|nr:hypothetical protein [Acinetobacter bohemicus]KAB0653157.1 hypothetical protein F7P73_08140 [Acinetobacter bohemicus]SFS99345.1 hypothetical protein SAMN05444586_101594 [Acinetobacter bohemicus]